MRALVASSSQGHDCCSASRQRCVDSGASMPLSRMRSPDRMTVSTSRTRHRPVRVSALTETPQKRRRARTKPTIPRKTHTQRKAMMRNVLTGPALAVLLVFGTGQATTPNETKTDADIKQILTEASIARHPGNCPCPYNVDRAGRQCGKRSAYSRPGGASPLCYANDISDDMVKEYRKELNDNVPRSTSPSRTTASSSDTGSMQTGTAKTPGMKC